MLEEFLSMLEALFSVPNLLYLLLMVDVFAVVGIFVNAFTGDTSPSRRRTRRKKPKPRRIDATKIFYNVEEPVISMEGEDGLSHVKEAVGAKLKPNGTLAQFPTPMKKTPNIFASLVHNAKNGIDTTDTKENKEDLKPNQVKEVVSDA